MSVDLEAIARRGRCEPSSLRMALPLLEQGYTPPFLSRYRRDELGSVDERSLWILSQAVSNEQEISQRRDELDKLWKTTQLVDPSIGRAIQKASSKRLLDRLSRRLKLELNDQPSDATRLAVRVLNPQKGDGEDLAAIAAKVDGISDADAAFSGFDDAVATRLCGDPRVIGSAVRWLVKNARIHISQIHDPHGGKDEADATASKGKSAKAATPPPAAASSDVDSKAVTEAVADTTAVASTDAAAPSGEEPAAEAKPAEATSEPAATPAVETASADQTPAAETTATETHASEAATEPTQTPAAAAAAPDVSSAEVPATEIAGDSTAAAPETTSEPAVAAKQSGKPATRENKKSEKAAPKKPKKISPRQRRRRWLVSVLKPLQGKRLPASKLSAFQIVMLGRALRSQVAVCSFEYDAKKLVDEITRTGIGLNRGQEAKLRETILINEANIREAAESAWWDEMQEQASGRLVSIAAENLRAQINRGGVESKVVLAIDAVGPRTAAASVVASDGRILHNEDIPCQLSKNLRSQAVLKMGELIHSHGIDLIVVSNGPARRACLAAIGDLIEQSPEKSVRWTLADRNGADAYAGGPVGDQEMKSTPRRFRAAAWIAFSILQPAQALAKVDPLKLRLGSFQRELADDALLEALRDVMTSGASRGGVDVNSAPATWLARLPGMNDSIAQAIDKKRRESLFQSRAELAELDTWDSLVSNRQALPFLRVFGSEESLDATLIHPDDYPLAQKLVKALELETPPAQPAGYTPPSFDGDATPEPSEKIVEAKVDDSLKVETFETTEEAKENFAGDLSGGEKSDSKAEDDSSAAVEPPAVEPDASAETPVENDAAASVPVADDDADSPPDAGDDKAAESPVSSEASSDQEAPAETEATPAAEPEVVEVPQSFKQPRPEPAKTDKCIKEWQVGKSRVRQIVHWLCDPFGDSDPSGHQPATLNAMPSLQSLKPGDEVIGVVVGVMPFGVFVELAPDCSGLVHVSRISENYVEDLHEAVQVGDVVTAWVTGTDEKRRRVALSAISPQRAAELERERSERPPRGRGGSGGGRGQEQGQKGAGGSRGGQAPRGRGGSTSSSSGGGGQQRGRTGGGSGRGDSRGGQRGRQGGRGDSRGRGRERKPEVYRVTGGGPEKPPITDEMKAGAEPLRSFGDLMQFYKDDKPEPPKPELPKPPKASATPPAPAESAPPAAAEPAPPEVSATDTETKPGDDATDTPAT